LFREYPRQASLISVFLVLAGLAEGVGIATVMPLINAIAGVPGTEASRLSTLVTDFMHWIRLDPTLGNMLVVIVTGMVLKTVLVLLTMMQVATAMSFVTTNLRFRLLNALLLARWSYFVRLRTGEIGNAITTEVNGAGAVFWGATNICTMAIQVLVYLVLASLVSWPVTISALGAGAVMFLMLNWLVGQSRRAGEMASASYQSMMRRLVDGLSSIKSIKAMAAEDRLEPLLRADNDGLFRASRLQLISKEAMTHLQEPLIIIFMAVGLFLTTRYQVAPFDQLVVMALLFQRMLSRIGRLQSGYQQLMYAQTFYRSLSERTSGAIAEREVFGDGASPASWRAIEARNVTFQYSDDAPIFDGVDLTIPDGKVTVLFGSSGAGKTTFADLIMGLQWPVRGEVLVDGQPLRAINLRDWRKKIGYVPQDLFLLNDTIKNNVTLGDTTIEPERIDEALRAAGAERFVQALTEGVDTLVGERGSSLSGGQRQRLAIARALVRSPRLLILDEPTTALDPATEAEICETLSRLSKRVTVLAISHQPAVAEIADFVYEFAGGQVKAVERTPPHRLGTAN
jgi:ATP-binding cassette subfamily C protein